MQALGNKLLALVTASPAASVIFVIALVFGLGLIWQSWQERRERRLMASVPTSRAADVGAMAPGTLVEVAGTLRCAAPITSEFAKQACAYYHAENIRREVWYDSDRKQQSRTSTTYKSIKQAPCMVEDESGKVAVDLTGATVEAVEVHNEVVGETSGSGELLGMVTGIGKGSNTLNRVERTLGFDIPIYVLGEVRADGSIGAPKKRPFLVNRTPEEERSKKLAESSSFGVKFAGVMLAIAFLSAAWAWYKAP